VFPRGDQYLTSDAVFGAKKSLIVDLKQVDDEALARKRGELSVRSFFGFSFLFFSCCGVVVMLFISYSTAATFHVSA
jgi:hypothetical protein